MAVGLGTGSPENISREAFGVLQAVDVIYCPLSRNGTRSHAGSRLERIDDFRSEVFEYKLDIQEGGEALRNDYYTAARRIRHDIKSNRTVAAVSVGDPSLYSTLGPLTETVAEVLPQATIKTVPGVSSVQSAASKLNRPLVQREDRFALIPLDGSNDVATNLWERFETLAFTKVNRGFGRLMEKVRDAGRTETSYLFERLGTDREEIFSLSRLEAAYDPPYFSLVLSFAESGQWI